MYMVRCRFILQKRKKPSHKGKTRKGGSKDDVRHVKYRLDDDRNRKTSKRKHYHHKVCIFCMLSF